MRGENHSNDDWFRRAYWLSLNLVWSNHAKQRSEERGIDRIPILPANSRLIHIKDTSNGIIAVWQIYQDGTPVVIVTSDLLHTNKQQRALVRTVYAENARRIIRQERRERRREARRMRRSGDRRPREREFNLGYDYD